MRELYYTAMEAARNEVEEAYFKARSDDDTPQTRRTFRHGYERAFQKLWREPVTDQQETLMLRSVGAMEIAEGNEGWERVPIDCPMLIAVRALRERYNWLAQVLYCDHGDNQGAGAIGWGIRFNLRDGHQFMYGPSIDAAIDAGRAIDPEAKP